jgi:two-component system chemotaxis sensor kinase CheA
VASERFAIPLTSLSETIVIEHKDIQTIEGKEVYNLRGEMLPIVSIARLFDLESVSIERSFVVVIHYGEKGLGLLVDELIGQHEIVVKSLGNYFEGLRGFAGAAEIGRHEVVLVLDIDSAIEESLRQRNEVSHV